MSQPITQRSGHFWRFNVWDKFTGDLVKTENGFKTQREAREARTIYIQQTKAVKVNVQKPNPAKNKNSPFYYGRINFGKGFE